MPYWNGTVYSSGLLTTDGDSGWFALPIIGPNRAGAVKSVALKLVPERLGSDETMDIDFYLAFDLAGAGGMKVHEFAQVTSTNAEEFLFLPGGDSEGLLYKEIGVGAGVLPALVPPWWKFVWVLGGTTKQMSFTVYGTLEF